MATFVFDGTVQRVIPKRQADRNREALVRVDRVVRAPDSLQDFAGQEVIVELGARAPRVGESLRFSTTPVTYGNRVVVRVERSADATKSAETGSAPPTEAELPSELKDRLASADAIVAGKVSGVGPASQPQRTGETAVSEHDPQWREATVAVTAVYKGRRVPKTIRVRFPASTDVAWVDAPKLTTGEQAVFLLSRAEAVFEIRRPVDLQPIERAAAIASAAARRSR